MLILLSISSFLVQELVRSQVRCITEMSNVVTSSDVRSVELVNDVVEGLAWKGKRECAHGSFVSQSFFGNLRLLDSRDYTFIVAV